MHRLLTRSRNCCVFDVLVESRQMGCLRWSCCQGREAGRRRRLDQRWGKDGGSLCLCLGRGKVQELAQLLVQLTVLLCIVVVVLLFFFLVVRAYIERGVNRIPSQNMASCCCCCWRCCCSCQSSPLSPSPHVPFDASASCPSSWPTPPLSSWCVCLCMYASNVRGVVSA